MNNNKNEMKSDIKSKVNSVGKTARDTMDNVKDSSSDSASDVFETVTEFGKNFINSLGGSKEKVYETATSTLNSLEKTVRTKPMAFVGGAAALGFITGYLLGKGRSPGSQLKAGVDKIKDQIEKNINKVSEHLQ
jgi:ElaB/YqjD/DUF883 family membrane-anchored ribosome-binding protein